MRKLRNEHEIMQHWKGNPEQPLVSVCCITYNHEPYIEDALEGFLIQETNFPFEILIHNDAPTDRNAYMKNITERYWNTLKNMPQKIIYIQADG
ncbi:MAG: glycosyltransferase [Candidatus Cloacimonadaceae bacterium]|nr:glycosyltransferase [Candidatus Cloacimonadaceae bacterium]